MTQPETIEFILEKLANPRVFTTRRMFGEYALYANKKVVGFVCDDILYVKITPQSAALEAACEKGPCYPGSKDYYIVEESLLTRRDDIAAMLISMAEHLPKSKKKKI